MTKVSLDTIKPWIIQRVTELLGIEDDVVTEFVFNMLESNQVNPLVVCTDALSHNLVCIGYQCDSRVLFFPFFCSFS